MNVDLSERVFQDYLVYSSQALNRVPRDPDNYLFDFWETRRDGERKPARSGSNPDPAPAIVPIREFTVFNINGERVVADSRREAVETYREIKRIERVEKAIKKAEARQKMSNWKIPLRELLSPAEYDQYMTWLIEQPEFDLGDDLA